jgi:hypothetical protein
MAKGIKELTPLESDLLVSDLLFETVAGQADGEGIYARRVTLGTLETFVADESRTDDAPVVALANRAKNDAIAHADYYVGKGTDGNYFSGLPAALKNGEDTTVINALKKEYELLGKIVRDGGAGDEYLSLLPDALKGEGVSLVSAIKAEYDRATAKEGAGTIPKILETVPASFVAAFNDVVNRFKATEAQDEAQTYQLNELRKDYLGEDVTSGSNFKKTITDLIGDKADLPYDDPVAKNIKAVKELAEKAPYLGTEATASLTGTGKNLDALRIKDSGVVTAMLADSAVTAAKLADEAVTEAKIEDSAVATAKLADGAVTAAKLTVAAINNETGDLADGAVTEAKIEDGAVTAAKLTVAAINNETGDLADDAVTEAKIEDGAVTAAKLTVAAIDNETGDLADGAVTEAKLAEGIVTLGRLAAGLGDGDYKIVIADGVITLAPLAV